MRRELGFLLCAFLEDGAWKIFTVYHNTKQSSTEPEEMVLPLAMLHWEHFSHFLGEFFRAVSGKGGPCTTTYDREVLKGLQNSAEMRDYYHC